MSVVISEQLGERAMPASERTVFDEEEVLITYVRRRGGKAKSIPVWFTVKDGKMELLPMYGLKTRWYADVEASGKIGLAIKGWRREAKPDIVKEARVIEGIKGRFGAKYGFSNVKKYYPTSEVALEVPV